MGHIPKPMAARVIETIVRKAIAAYQLGVSPLLGPHCRYYPSCSQYMSDAIQARGLVAGVARGILRVARCNPLFPGGYDPATGGDRAGSGAGGASMDRNARGEKE